MFLLDYGGGVPGNSIQPRMLGLKILPRCFGVTPNKNSDSTSRDNRQGCAPTCCTAVAVLHSLRWKIVAVPFLQCDVPWHFHECCCNLGQLLWPSCREALVYFVLVDRTVHGEAGDKVEGKG